MKKKIKEITKITEQVAKAKTFPKKKHLLIQGVTVGETVMKAGESIFLTEAGRIYFKSIKKIK